jgi:hypothetical protein
LDVPAALIDSKTYVPVRFVSEAFNANVIWLEKLKTIFIQVE